MASQTPTPSPSQTPTPADRDAMLRRLMGDKLAPRKAAPARLPQASQVKKGELAKGGTNPHALQHEDWTRRRGSEIARKTRDRRAPGDFSQHEADCSDFFDACFAANPKPTADCLDPFKSAFIKELLDSGSHKGTRTQTAANDTASEVAAMAIAESFRQAVARGRKPGSAADQAAEAASDAVDEFNETQLAFGRRPGRHDGADAGLDPADAISLFERVRDNPYLRTIIELAGKFRRFGQSKQRRKTSHGAEDFIGTGLGGIEQVSRLLPSELANMVMPVLGIRMDALRRLAERQAMVKILVNHEPVAKGPVIGCFDGSSSMMGTPIQQCKALALAMAWIAREQKRWCCLVEFSSAHQRRVLVLDPRKPWSDSAILAWLTGFYAGGTSPPVHDMPEIYARIGAPAGKTDLYYVTDGEVSLSPEIVEAFNAWRRDPRVKAKVTTLLLGCGAGGMEEISDEVHLVSRIDVDQAGVAAVLSF